MKSRIRESVNELEMVFNEDSPFVNAANCPLRRQRFFSMLKCSRPQDFREKSYKSLPLETLRQPQSKAPLTTGVGQTNPHARGERPRGTLRLSGECAHDRGASHCAHFFRTAARAFDRRR